MATLLDDALYERLTAVRRGTHTLLDLADESVFRAQPDPEFSPIGWHAGHIAAFEAYWVLEQCKGDPPLSPAYARLFSPVATPKPERRHLPSRTAVLEFLQDVRRQVLRYLEQLPAHSDHWLRRDGRIVHNILQHECQHSETIATVLHMQDSAHPKTSPLSAVAEPATEMLWVAGGPFVMGGGSGSDWYDNEVPAHTVNVEGFFIDAHPVTNAQFAGFLAAGGYATPAYWSRAGWAWRTQHGIEAPPYWRREGAGWVAAGHFGNGTLVADAPVMNVSWFEADAYARWRGVRLPTEAEWEKAAGWYAQRRQALPYAWGTAAPDASRCNHERHFGITTPVGQFTPRSPAGCADMNGNVWEWTASLFAPYPRFEPYPYAGYSLPYFDGGHYVLRGGSWASRGSIVRNTFRNWFVPETRRIFAGFRCACHG